MALQKIFPISTSILKGKLQLVSSHLCTHPILFPTPPPPPAHPNSLPTEKANPLTKLSGLHGCHILTPPPAHPNSLPSEKANPLTKLSGLHGCDILTPPPPNYINYLEARSYFQSLLSALSR